MRRTVNVRVSEEVHGCDNCRRKMDPEADDLRMTIFEKEGGESQQAHFCSWKCVLQYLPKIKSNYFASLPFLNFDNSMPKGSNAADLIAFMKKLRIK